MPNEHHQLAPNRAAHYRAYAVQLAGWQAEPHQGFNYQLLELALRYEQLAESVEHWKLVPTESDHSELDKVSDVPARRYEIRNKSIFRPLTHTPKNTKVC